MSKYIPLSAKELYEKMLAWDNLRGKIFYDEKSEEMTWVIADNLRLEIGINEFEGMVHVFDSAHHKISPLTHWHPDSDEIYEEMIDINEGKIKFAYINTLFGKMIAYVGVPSSKKKYRFRLIHFLGEENS